MKMRARLSDTWLDDMYLLGH